MTRRRPRAVVLAAVLLVLLVGCSSPTLVTPREAQMTMTPSAAKRINDDIAEAIRGSVGRDGWEDVQDSFGCSSDERVRQPAISGARWLPLDGTPDEVAERVRVALAALGYEGLHVEHDPTLEPPRSIVAYPRGYLRGSDPDGFGFEFDAGTDFAYFDVYGHCVSTDG